MCVICNKYTSPQDLKYWRVTGEIFCSAKCSLEWTVKNGY